MGRSTLFKHTLARRGKVLVFLTAVLVVGAGAAAIYHQNTAGEPAAPNAAPAANKGGDRRGARQGNRPVPVKATTARIGELDITLGALGTVTPSNVATVRPRVEGQLTQVHFREGQLVRAGDLLAEIDPRPFQIALDQARGQLARDEALLAAARVDLERYRSLLAKDSIARQQVDSQEALVRQYSGVVESDKAAVENTRLQLGFARITAPASGRLGLRLIDAGNIVRTNDASGLVVITQTQPIHAVFAIPAENLSGVAQRLGKKETLTVEAWDRDGRTLLAKGKLISLDNQIDVATGTVKLKAEFANQDNTLFPNQFVNIKLQVEKHNASLLLAASAVQKNAEGSFVYLINRAEGTVESRRIRVGAGNGEWVVVTSGLESGDQAVIDGTDRLRPGAKVEVLSVDGQPQGGARREEGAPAPDKAPQGKAGADAPAKAASRATTPERPAHADGAARPRTPAPENETRGGGEARGGAEGERRGARRCAPEVIANDPEAAARCERWRARREAGGGPRPD